MNTTTKTILISLLVLVIGGGLFFAGQAYGRWNSASSYGDGWSPMMRTGRGAGYGPGMMGNYGRNGGYGPMMNNRGGGYGPGMNGYTATNAQPLTVDDAKAAAQKYVDSLNISGLEVAEEMVFNNNAYVVVKETNTGMGAFELLVNSGSDVAYPEYGPNMMWNLKYSGLNHQNMMAGNNYRAGGMGRGYFDGTVNDVSADMPVTKEQAIQSAQAYLDQYFPGTKVEKDGTAFYGYYTFDFSKDGKVVGMLSVNGYSSQVFYHTWHGTFVTESGMQ